MQVVGRPMQKASGLISNMAQFEAHALKAASSSKGAKEAKAKESKEDREKREKYEKNLKKAEEHIAAKRHKEAVDALTEARKYAKPGDLKAIDERLDEQKKLVGQGDLFAMMEEPEQAQPQQSQVQQPTQQPATAQVQPQPMPEPVKPVQQPTVQQQAAPQHQSAMPQQEMPAQAAQQPYSNPRQGYGGRYGYPQSSMVGRNRRNLTGGIPNIRIPMAGQCRQTKVSTAHILQMGSHGMRSSRCRSSTTWRLMHREWRIQTTHRLTGRRNMRNIPTSRHQCYKEIMHNPK